jgi:hypothetical protein
VLHPQRPVLPPLSSRLIQPSIHPLPAQESPKRANPILMINVIMGIRNKHPDRINVHPTGMDATIHAHGFPTRHQTIPLPTRPNLVYARPP